MDHLSNGNDDARSHKASQCQFVKSRSALLIDELFNNRHNVSSSTSSLLQLAKEELKKLPKFKPKTRSDVLGSDESSSRPTASSISSRTLNSSMLVQSIASQEKGVSEHSENDWTACYMNLGKIGENIASPATSDYSCDSGFTDQKPQTMCQQEMSSMNNLKENMVQNMPLQQSKTHCSPNEGEFQQVISYQSGLGEFFNENGSQGTESSHQHYQVTAQDWSCEDSQIPCGPLEDSLPKDVSLMNNIQMKKDFLHWNHNRRDLALNHVKDHSLQASIPSLPNTGSDLCPTHDTFTEKMCNPKFHNPHQCCQTFLVLHKHDSKCSLADPIECPQQGRMSTLNSRTIQFNPNIDVKNASPSNNVAGAIKSKRSMHFLADAQSCLVSKSEVSHKELLSHCISELAHLEHASDSNSSKKFNDQLTKDNFFFKNKQWSETSTVPNICGKPEFQANDCLEASSVLRNELTGVELSAPSFKSTDQPGINATKADTFSFDDIFSYQNSLCSKSKDFNDETLLKNNSSHGTDLQLSSFENKTFAKAPGFKHNCKCEKLLEKCYCEYKSLTVGCGSNDEIVRHKQQSSSSSFKSYVKTDFTSTLISQTKLLATTSNNINCTGESSAQLKEDHPTSGPSEVSSACTDRSAYNQLQSQQCPDLANVTTNLLALEHLLSDTASSIYCSGEQDNADNSSQVLSSIEKATSQEQPSTSPARSSSNCSYVDTLSCTIFRELELSALAPSVVDSKKACQFLPPFVECKFGLDSGMQQSEASVEQQNQAGEMPPSKDDILSETGGSSTWSPGQADGLHLLDVGRCCKQLPKSSYILAVESVPKLSNTQADMSQAINMEQKLPATAEHKILDVGLPSELALSSSYKMLYSDLELSDDSDQDTTDGDCSYVVPGKDCNAISNTTQSSDDRSALVRGKREGEHDDEVGSSRQDNSLEDKTDENHSKEGNAKCNNLSRISVEKETSSDVLNVSMATDRLMNASLDANEACSNSCSALSSNVSSCEQNKDSDESDLSEHIPHGQKHCCPDGLYCGSKNGFLDSGVPSCSSRTPHVNDMQEMLFDVSSKTVSLPTDESNVRQSQQGPAPNRKSFCTDLDHTFLSFPLLGLAEQSVTSWSKMCNESQVRGCEREVLVKAQRTDSVVMASSNSKALSAAETFVEAKNHRPPAKTNGIKLQQSNMTPKNGAQLSKQKFNAHQNSILDLMCTRTKRGKRKNFSIIPTEPKNIAGGTSQNYSEDNATSNEHMGSKIIAGAFSTTISPARDLKEKNFTKKSAEAIASVDVRGENLKKIDAIEESSNCIKSLAENELNLHTSNATRNAHAEVYVNRDTTDNLQGHIEKRLNLTAEDGMYIKHPKLNVSSNTTDCKQGFCEKGLDKEITIAKENNFAKLNDSKETTGGALDPVEKVHDFKAREMKKDNFAKFLAIRTDNSQDSITSNLDQGVNLNPVSKDFTLLKSFECTATKSFEDSARGHFDWKNESFQISNLVPKSPEKCFPKFRYTFSPVINNHAEEKRSMTKEGSCSYNSDLNGDQRDTVEKITQSYNGKMLDEKPYFSSKIDPNETMKSHSNLLKTLPSCERSIPTAATNTSLVSNSLSRASENCVGPQISCIRNSEMSGNASNDSVTPYSVTEPRLSNRSSNSRSTTENRMLYSGRSSVKERKISRSTENVHQTEMYDIMCTRNKRGRRKQIMKMPVKLDVDDTELDKAINKDSLPVQNDADRQNVDVNSGKDIPYVEPDAKDSKSISHVKGSDKSCGSWQRENAEIKRDGVLENSIKTCRVKDSFTKFVELKKMRDSESLKDTFRMNHSLTSASSIQPNQSCFSHSDFDSLKSTPNMAIQCKLPTIALPGANTLTVDCEPSGASSSSCNSAGAESQDAAPLHSGANTLTVDCEPSGASSSSCNSAGAESQDAAPLHLANQTGQPHSRITKPVVYKDRGDCCETSTLSAGLENAPLTKPHARVVTDLITVLDECDANDLKRNSERELKRHCNGLRVGHRKSYVDYSSEWESKPHDIVMSKKTSPTSKQVSNLRINQKLCTRKAIMTQGSQGSQFYSEENAFDSKSLSSWPFSKYGAQTRVSDCTSQLIFDSFDSIVSPSSHGSPSDKVDSGNSGKVLLATVSTMLSTEQSVFHNPSSKKQSVFPTTSSSKQPALRTTSSQKQPVLPTTSNQEQPVPSTPSSQEQPVISTLSSKKQSVLPTTSIQEQPVISTPSSKEQPVIFTSSSKEQPVVTLSSKDQTILPTTSSKDQPILSITSSNEKPVLSSTSREEKPVLASTSSEEQPPISTVVWSEQPALSSTSITEQSVIPKALNTDPTVDHIASHHEQEYFSTEQSAVHSCPERAEFSTVCARNPRHSNPNLPIMSTSEQSPLLITSNNKLSPLTTSVNQEQTTHTTASNEEKAVLPILSNEEPSIYSSTSSKEENTLIVSSKVPSLISTSSHEQPALHVSPSKEELAFFAKRQVSQLASDQDPGRVSLWDQTAISNFTCSSHVLCSPKRTSSISCASNPQTLFYTNVNQSETNNILMPSQILQASINAKENYPLFDSVNGSLDNTFLFDQTVETPKWDLSSATTNIVNIYSNSKLTHLGSISSQSPSCEDVMDVVLPKGYAIVKLDDQGEPCDIVQSILAKIMSRSRKHSECLDDHADSHRTEPSMEVLSCGRLLSGNVTPPCGLKASFKSCSMGCNEERSNLFVLPSAAVGSPVHLSTEGNVSEFGLTANKPQNHTAILIQDVNYVTTRSDAANNSSPNAATTDQTREVATANWSAPEASAKIPISVDASANNRTPMTAETDSSLRTASRNNTPSYKVVATNVVVTGDAASNSVTQEVPPIRSLQEATVAIVRSSDASEEIVFDASETNDDAVSCASFSDEGDDVFMTVVIDSDDCIYELNESFKGTCAEDLSTDTNHSTGDSVRGEGELKCSTGFSNLKACKATQTAAKDVHEGQNFDTNCVNHAPLETSTSSKNVKRRSLKEPKISKGYKRTAGACSRAPKGHKRKVADMEDFEAFLKSTKRKPASM